MSKENNELPSAWQNSTLAELVDRLQYGYTAKAVNEPNGTQYLRITDIRDTSIDWPNVPRCKISEVDFPKYQLHHGDIVFARSGSIEKAARVENPPHAVFASYLIRGRPLATWIGDWLKQFIRSADYYRQIGAAGAGIGMQNVNAKKLGRVTIPIPPVPEQQRIVAKIESLQERSARARAALAEVGPLLEQFRRSVLSAAFSGRLTADWRAANPDVEPASELLHRIRTERRHRWEQAELAKYETKGKKPPKDWKSNYKEPHFGQFHPGWPTDFTALWEVVPLELLVAPERGIPYGIVKTGESVVNGVPTVRCGDIKRFAININELKKVAPAIHQQYRRTCLEGGEVLIAIRGTVGETAVAPASMRGMNISREIALVPTLPAVEAQYVMYLLASPSGQRMISASTKGVAQSGINLSDLRSLPAPLPPLREQTEIVRRIEQALRKLDELRSLLTLSQEDLTQLDQSILAKAFRGELVPQDPSDEPAAELLARIAAARKAAASSSKTTKRARKPAARKAADP